MMRGQVLRFFRPRPFFEVGRRPDHGKAHVGTDAHGDHVLCDLLAEPNAGVVTLGDDIGQSVIDDDLDLDVRIFRQQLCQSRPQERDRRMLARTDADGAGGLLAQRAQRREFGIDFLKAGPDRTHEPFARLGRRDAARGAGQQPKSEPLFQAADGVAQRRLRHAELGCRFGEAAVLRDGQESQQIVDVFARHS